MNKEKIMKATFILLISIIMIFAIQSFISGFTETFLLNSNEVLVHPWTLITSMFLHGDFTHLFYNAFALLIFGLILEDIIGTKRFYIIYFVGGIVASIAAAYFYPASLGASGAVFAILGMLAALRPKMIVWVSYIPMPMAIASIIWVLIDLIGFIAPSGVANAAHIVGLIFGAVVGIFMRDRFAASAKQKQSKILSNRDMENWENDWMGISEFF